MNTFRILSRTVNGRKVEVGRTLVASRALPVRVVAEAAPQSIYSEFDRFLIGLGVDGSIVPLMRATPPSGIHWMTAAELASTRIGNDPADAATLIGREAEAQAAAANVRNIRLDAALRLDDARRWKGEVVWRVDATSPGNPSLTGDRVIPERRLSGSVSVRADAALAAPAALKLTARFASQPGADASEVLTVPPPSLCDLQACSDPFSGPTVFDEPEAAFGVVPAWRTGALADLHRRDWLTFRARTEAGPGWLALALSSPDASAVAERERLCCAFAAADWPWNAPVSSLPDFPEAASRFPHPRDRPPPRGTGPRQSPGPHVRHARPARCRADAAARVRRASPGIRDLIPTRRPVNAGVPGTTVLLGTAELPASGLRTSIEVASSKPGVLGRLTIRLHSVADAPGLFGPFRDCFVFSAYDAGNHPLLTIAAVSRFSEWSGVEARVDIPETGPAPGSLQVGFDDAEGRRVTLAFPFDPALAALLQAAWRGVAPGTS